MSRIGLLLVLLAAGSNITFAECTCPEYGVSSYEETASSKGLRPFISLNNQIIGCGFVDSQQKQFVIASEFAVYRCEADGKLAPLLFKDALIEAKFTMPGNSMVITEFEHWPFGKNWKWVDVPTMRYSLTTDTKTHREVKWQIVIEPVALTKHQIADVMKEYARFKKTRILFIPPEKIDTVIETMIGKLLVASLAGSEAAAKALEEMTSLDAHYGETAHEALGTYYLYRHKLLLEQ